MIYNPCDLVSWVPCIRYVLYVSSHTSCLICPEFALCLACLSCLIWSTYFKFLTSSLMILVRQTTSYLHHTLTLIWYDYFLLRLEKHFVVLPFFIFSCPSNSKLQFHWSRINLLVQSVFSIILPRCAFGTMVTQAVYPSDNYDPSNCR